MTNNGSIDAEDCSKGFSSSPPKKTSRLTESLLGMTVSRATRTISGTAFNRDAGGFDGYAGRNMDNERNAALCVCILVTEAATTAAVLTPQRETSSVRFSHRQNQRFATVT